jgi:signal transduction histidine kinase
VSADPISLRRIIENLVRNALEALGDGPGEVTVGVRDARDEDGRSAALITVRDNGPGIAPESQARIFEDFYTTKSTGAGLGLSIVRRLVGDVGGSVKLESQPGAGTTFSVWIPMSEEGGGHGVGADR